MAMTASAFYAPNPENLDHIIGIAKNLLEQDFKRLSEDDPHAFATRMKRKQNEIYVNI